MYSVCVRCEYVHVHVYFINGSAWMGNKVGVHNVYA